jgi:hypothetical protein
MNDKIKEVAILLIDKLPRAELMLNVDVYLDKQLKKNSNKEPLFMEKKKYPVYQFGDDGSDSYIFLADEERKKVLYFVRYRFVKHNGFKFGRQVLMARRVKDDEPHPATHGFAQHIFFNVLMPKYHALILDKEQMQLSKEFWYNAITAAWRIEKIHVYLIDRISTPNRLIELFNRDDLGKYQDEIWGTDTADRAFIYTFAVISDKPLDLNTFVE